MSKKKGIIMIAIGALIFVSGVKAYVSAPEITNKLSNAVFIDDGKILPENEGKLVVVSGKIEAELPLTDSLTGIKLPYFAADREVYKYEYKHNSEENIFEWEKIQKDYTKDDSSKSTQLISDTIFAPSKIGEFNISNELLISVSRPKDFTAYDEDNVKESGLGLFGGDSTHKYYLSAIDSDYLPENKTSTDDKQWIHESAFEGNIKIAYKTISDDDPLIYTFIGIQKGSNLEKSQDLDMSPVYKGTVTAQELVDSNNKGAVGGLCMGAVIALLLVFFGIRNLKGSKVMK